MILLIIGVLVLIVAIAFFVLSKQSKKRSMDDGIDAYNKLEEAQDARRRNICGVCALVVGAVLIILSCITSVPTGHTGVPVTFGKVSNYVLDAGIRFKAPWQDVVKMDNRVQKETAELSCFSSDIQEVDMLYTVNFQIRQSDAMVIYSTIGKDYYQKVIVPCITESVKAVTAKYTAENLIADRNDLAQQIEQDLYDKLDSYNIILVSTSIEDMDFTEEFTNAVEAKQVAQQNKLKAETEADQKRVEAQATADAQVIAAKGEADALVIQAEAEANAYQKISQSLTDNVLDKMYYDSWNGVLPSVVGSDSVVVMPNADTNTEKE